MKRFCIWLVFSVTLVVSLSAHDAHEGVMDVELGLKLTQGQAITVKYRALNLGSGHTWDRLNSGQIARPFPIAELTTSVALKAGASTIPAGTHQLFFIGDQSGHSIQIGGTAQNPGPRVPVRVTNMRDEAEHLIITATHGEGSSDVALIMVYGNSLGWIVLDIA